ncbi:MULTISPECIES: TnsA-like heteromeric transposase endonuclease subunit [unclassified Frankia]|uniref:TnsA-like heteromeric transposase endonuclease subunit n=1 Tax=unclassified Frankia TaxID=2632575 RepID=UPI002AD286FD|nr:MULTISPECIES: TnsA-like heteromeric transposase endonuclease subunit [unclassified Frankia]
MADLPVLSGGSAGALSDGGFEVSYVADGGAEQRVLLVDARSVLLEEAAPARRFRSVRTQRHFSGLWWSATVCRHVGYESWLERDHLMLLDFDPAVVGIASQPFWLSWVAPAGDAYRHVPDYFARRADGSAVVVDCRPPDRIGPRDAVKFEATRQACGLVGWEYRLVGAPERIAVGNVRWLAGYRHPRHRLAEVAAVLRDVFARPARLMTGAERAGDPVAVLPVLFHLLWRQELTVDLSVPLHASALVTAAG